MTSYLSLGRPGLIKGDFNACCDLGQSTSIHSLMDAPELHAWVQIQSSVLQIDVWQWVHGSDHGYTYHSTQYKDT